MHLQDLQIGASKGEVEYSLLDLYEELEYLRDYIQSHSPDVPKGTDYSEHQRWYMRCNLCLTRALVSSGLLLVDMCRPLARLRNTLGYVQGEARERRSSTPSRRPAEVVRAADVAEKLVAGLRVKAKK